MLESCENMAMSTAILCLVICICEIINKVIKCGRSAFYVKSLLSFAHHW